MTHDQIHVLREYFDLLLEIDPQRSFGSLKNVFLDPVKDAAKVSSGELKKVGVKSAGAVAKIGNLITTSLLPTFFDNKFNEINSFIKDQISSVESENREAWKEITPHTRSAGAKLLFMADPVGFITVKMASSTADEIADVIRPFLDSATSSAVSTFSKRVGQRLRMNKSDNDRMTKWFLNDLKEGIVLIGEAAVSDEVMRDIVKSPEFKNLIVNSPMTSKLKQKAKEIGDQVAADFTKIADAASKATSLADIQRDFGIKIPDNDLQSMKKQGMDEAAVLATLRQKIFEKMVTSVTTHLEKAGFQDDPDNPYFVAMKNVLEHVKELTSKE